jgi:hypothetical protein
MYAFSRRFRAERTANTRTTRLFTLLQRGDEEDDPESFEEKDDDCLNVDDEPPEDEEDDVEPPITTSGDPPFAHHYYRYGEMRATVEAIFAEFAKMSRGFVARMSRDTEFPQSTIAHRRRRRSEDQEWRPFRQRERLVEGRRIFTDAQEETITQIEERFWSRNRRLWSQTFRDLVFEYWRDHRQATEQQERFSASNRFRLAFFRHHRLSFRVPSRSRNWPVQYPTVANNGPRI